MHHHYSLYGLSLSSNRAIPGLIARQPGVPIPDLTIEIGVLPPEIDVAPRDAGELWWASPWVDEEGRPQRVIRKVLGGAYYRMLYRDGFEFVLDRELRRMWVKWPPELSDKEFSIYLLGPVMGTVLRLRGTVCLHASAVVIEAGAVAFFGAAEAGKSTTAAGLLQQGHPVLSDDVVPLEEHGGRFFAQCGYPNLRLCSETVEQLYGDENAHPLIVNTWNKRRVDLSGPVAFAAKPVPLSAMYMLEERRDGATAHFEAMPARDALMALVANTYVNSLIEGEMRAREFGVLSRLIQQAPVRRASAPKDFRLLPSFCRAIIEDVRQNARLRPYSAASPALRSAASK